MMDFPTSCDWISTVRQDLAFLQIDLSDTYIKLMSKYEFKRLLKNQIQVKRREFLENLKSIHSKTRKLEIEEKPKEYLTTKFLSVTEKQFLFSLKCNMSKKHFKQMHADLKCR